MITASIVMAITALGALISVIARNIVHAIFGLAVALVGIAGIFVVLDSPFIAVMEILIYVGGISIAMVFAVMMSSVGQADMPERGGRRFVSGLVAGAAFAMLVYTIMNSNIGTTNGAQPAEASVKRIGIELLNRYNVVFETLSAILLLAIIGAITIARRANTNTPKEDTAS